jgi:acetyl-CoA carboxylase biotin carboxyl carrier protein
MSDDKPMHANEQVLRTLCEETQALVAKMRGPVSRLALQAGECRVEVEWHEAAAAAPAAAAHAASVEAPTEQAVTAPSETRHAITAPLVGTFYRAPEPGAKPFVEEGDIVEEGQDVAIVEAMKIMNRVQADRAGRVAEIVAVDGNMVEFGQDLMYLEPLDPDD